MTDRILELKEVTKRYGRDTPLREVSLRLAAGERLALLGHNGAGKTTLIRAVLGLTRIDAGRITVFGSAAGSAVIRSMTGYLPENIGFHKALTGREQLTALIRLKGGPVRAVPGLMDRVGLAQAMDKRIGAYSKGMRQRLGLAQMLIGEPRLVVLDEPTSGLDSLSRTLFYDMIAELAASGAGVLMASHELTEIEARTERLALMRNGRLVADADLSTLRTDAGLPIRVRIKVRSGQRNAVADRLDGARINGHAVEVTCDPGTKIARLAEITALGADIDDIDVIPPSLEDIYRHYCGASIGQEEAP